MSSAKFKCSKCGNKTYKSGEIRAAGSFWTKVFNIQNRKFVTISCEKCGYTDIYLGKKASTAENILDFFGN